MILAPFQKLTQVEFINIKIKESAVQFLTIVNPHDKIKQVIEFIHVYLFCSHLFIYLIIFFILNFTVYITTS